MQDHQEPPELDPEILGIFLDEAEENLAAWEKACLRWEQGEGAQAYDGLFRVAHNLKGSSRGLGLMDLGAFIHKAEDFIVAQKGEPRLAQDRISLLLDINAHLSRWVENLRSDPGFKADSAALEARLAHSGEIPKPGEMPEPTQLGDLLVQRGLATSEQVEEAARLQNRKLGEILVESGVVEAESVQKALEEQQARQPARPDETIRISRSRLDRVLQLIGELSTHQSIIHHARKNGTLESGASYRAIDYVTKMTKELQTQVLSLRMQPLTGLFQRLERTSRDLNGHLGKNVQLILKGADVELDKSVIEKISEPLVHILRNAIDHGIGDPGEWAETGKKEGPRVQIEALQDPSGISICIKDNGRGIDSDAVYRAAVEKGLVKKETPLDEKRKLELILLPGFSMAKKVTDISGRGVGMDVVQRAVTELGGRLQIESWKGQGTAFTITLPTSLNIIDALIIGVEGVQYAVPIGDLVEVLDHSRLNEQVSATATPFFELRGNVLPVRELRRHLVSGSKRPGGKSLEGGRYVLITRTQEAQCAFVIDEVLGKQHVVVRQLSGSLATLDGIHGGTILANGEPGFILDLPHLAGKARAAA